MAERYQSLLDTVTVSTPEGVDLEITLAGLGSRMLAAIVDAVIVVALLVAVSVLVNQFDSSLVSAVGIVVMFVLTFGYDVLFETLASGRTPGKRWNGLRVVRTGGQPVGFLTSSVRNLMRIVDFLPALYGVGMVAVLATERNQRLGDLAAGTLVVREHHGGRHRGPSGGGSFHETALGVAAPAWDVSAITSQDLATVRRFLERRWELSVPARARLAETIGSKLWPKVVGAPQGLEWETFLEKLVAAKSRSV